LLSGAVSVYVFIAFFMFDDYFDRLTLLRDNDRPFLGVDELVFFLENK